MQFEKCLLDNQLSEASFVTKNLWSNLSEKLNNVDKAISEQDGDLTKLREKRESIIEMAHFFMDPEHPSMPNRAKFAQECFEKKMKSKNKMS